MSEHDKKTQDKEIGCDDCKMSFVFTVAEQKFFMEKGFTSDPKRCKPCRDARKSQASIGQARHPRSGARDGSARAGVPATSRRAAAWQFQRYPGQRNQQASGQKGPAGRGLGARVRPGGRPGAGILGRPGDRPGSGAPVRRSGRPGLGAGHPARGAGSAYRKDNRASHPTVRPIAAPGGLWIRSPAARAGRPVGSAPGGEIQLHAAVCTDCTAATKVPFRPNGLSPVYCRMCLPKHKARKSRPPTHRRDAPRGA